MHEQIETTRLLRFLTRDPSNPRLLADAAEAAYAAGDLPTAADLIARLAALGDLPAPIQNLGGLIALRQGRFADAARAFEAVLAHDPDAAEARLNLAWARYHLHDFAGARALLDDGLVERLPAAAALRIQALHQLGYLDESMALARGYEARHGSDAALMMNNPETGNPFASKGAPCSPAPARGEWGARSRA